MRFVSGESIELKTRREGDILEEGFTLTDCRSPRLHMTYQRTINKITYRLHIAMPLDQPWKKLNEWCVTEERFDESEE